MCSFFSFLSNGQGKYFYLNAEQRKEAWAKDENPDSHSYIVKYFQEKEQLAIGSTVEDKFNKYEFVIVKGGFKFVKDQINTKNDSVEAEKWVRKLFQEIDAGLFDSETAYLYCRDVEDRPEIRERITDSEDAYWYCKYVEDRPEMRDLIINSQHAYLYCRDVEDRPEIRERITDSEDAYWYCKYVEDRPEMRELAEEGGYYVD